jgi:hypothetical protein
MFREKEQLFGEMKVANATLKFQGHLRVWRVSVVNELPYCRTVPPLVTSFPFPYHPPLDFHRELLCVT